MSRNLLPVSEALSQVDPIFHGSGEFFHPRQIGAKNGLSLLAHVARKTLDTSILRRPRTLAKRIPLQRPSTALHACRLRAQRQGSPNQGRSLEPVLCRRNLFIGKFEFSDPG